MKRALLLLSASLLLIPAWAGPGHDHGDEAAPVTAGGPRRLPDGSVFLPKPAQRQLGLRTQAVAAAELPRSQELQGQVVMDPNAGGPVQAAQSGRLIAPPQGLPTLGQRVQRGQLLGYVEPLAGALERSAQAAQLAELRAALRLAEQRAQRLRELADTVPRREIEAVQAEVEGLRARIAALGQGLSGREALHAPVSGVIASAHAVAGQIVEARELLFEVVDPQRLRIEALAYDISLANDIGAAFVAGESAQPLRFLGAGSRLREQALPLNFNGAQGLALGQSVRVVVQSRSRIQGHAVPAQALVKNPSNQTIVWVKQAPERFVPRVVQVQALDGARVAVTQGLNDGERVVTKAATLLNQVR
ncbi:efflux RND transporter periplasmic adaptor subunit [Inhella sp.]|uniref:efflux RND transporter periplasmic adaptor subunit n=1 Tax=Inhella sp. TaxID=1921806 RepID=UPI0035B23F42